MTGKVSQGLGGERKLVTFTLQKQLYGVPVNSVREVIHYCEVSPIPGSAQHIMGIINLRGQVVTVIDICHQLNLAAAPIMDQSKIIILEVGNSLLGIVVDSVADVITLSPEQLENPPGLMSDSEEKRLIHAVAKLDDELLILLDLERVITKSDIIAAAHRA